MALWFWTSYWLSLPPHKQLSNRHNFWKMCKYCVHCKIDEILLFHCWLCLKSHQWVTEQRIFILSSFLRNYSSNKLKSACILIVIHCIVSFDVTQKCDDSWLPGAESFLMVYMYNINDFAAIISAATIPQHDNSCDYRARQQVSSFLTDFLEHSWSLYIYMYKI